MPIKGKCECGREFHMSPTTRDVKCPGCRESINVRAAIERLRSGSASSSPPPSRSRRPSTPRRAASRDSEAPVGERTRRTYLWLLLALVPLALSMHTDEPMSPDERLDLAYEQATPEQQERLLEAFWEGSEDAIWAALPGNKLPGAAFGRTSLAHWLLAIVSTAGFLAVLIYGFPNGTATRNQMLATAAFTASVGIFLLLGLQYAANTFGGVIPLGIGPVSIFLWFMKFIAFSYAAAEAAVGNFFLNFFGYSAGIGFCEEVTKVLPVWWVMRGPGRPTWQTVMAIGFASGVGFGVSEGNHYSTEYYHGVDGFLIYVVRYVSCVGLHAVWAGAAAMMLWRRYDVINQQRNVWGHFFTLFVVLSVPILLHGFYNTSLAHGHNFMAVIAGLLSFGWLYYQVEMASLEPAT